jgi:flavin-dependent dehydrogenase
MRGLRVVLYEREPGTRDRPGETLHPGVEPLLSQLGVGDRLASVTGIRHRGIWIEWGGPRRFEAFGVDAGNPWEGFQVWRADFDAMLLDRARELGVTVRAGCAALSPRMQDGVVSGVVGAEGEIAARIVVDATGAARWLGRALRIAARPRSPQFVARYGYVEGDCPARNDAPLLVGDPSGWTWTARVRPDVYQWTRVRFGKTDAGAGPPPEFAGLTRLGPVRGADVTWRLAERTAGSGWFMVGDAAAVLDPTSSHGVLKGLMTGMMAGHLSAASLSGKAPPAEIAAAYHDWIARWFAADSSQLQAFYRKLAA